MGCTEGARETVTVERETDRRNKTIPKHTQTKSEQQPVWWMSCLFLGVHKTEDLEAVTKTNQP